MGSTDISYLGLGFGIITLLIPIIIFYKYKTSLSKPTIAAFSRMLLQLAFVGIYLKYIFDIDSIILNILWVIIMVIAASFSVSQRSDFKLKIFLLPILISISTNVIINSIFFAFLILSKDQFLSARYLIPIMGMVIGNTLNSTIVGIRSYKQQLLFNEDEYCYNLMCGAEISESQNKFISNSLKEAFNPTIASTAVIGLIWLPGMMTGQILGGSDPFVAIKYQIVIIITIFVGSVLTVLVAILLINKISFDKYGNIKKDLLTEY